MRVISGGALLGENSGVKGYRQCEIHREIVKHTRIFQFQRPRMRTGNPHRDTGFIETFHFWTVRKEGCRFPLTRLHLVFVQGVGENAYEHPKKARRYFTATMRFALSKKLALWPIWLGEMSNFKRVSFAKNCSNRRYSVTDRKRERSVL